MDSAARRAMQRGCNYLLEIQDSDGAWRDYQLPVGTSDQWTTAFVGLAVAEAADLLCSSILKNSAHRAADFLLKSLKPGNGWGFNAGVDTDTDSTAHALMLLRRLSIPLPAHAEAFVLAHRQEDGGFSTYLEKTYWGRSHPDVTAAAGLALSAAAVREIRQELIHYCASCRLEDGSWPTYWWRNHAYGNCYMLLLHERLGLFSPASFQLRIDSCFDLAWALACLTFTDQGASEITEEFAQLYKLQEPCGRWPASSSLRVTDPGCAEPWSVAEGKYYPDHKGTITTASAIRAVSLIECRFRPQNSKL